MLDLQSKQLAGPISPHIGNLSFLRDLYLQNNTFGPEIPMELGNLRRLQRLRLHNNSITGEIPVNISSCSNLVRINLSGNKLVGNIPAQFGLLSMLQALILDKNDLTGSIPPSLGNLSSLTSIGLSYNNLNGSIPESLGRLKNLSFIGLGFNRLSNSIPATIFNLSSVTELDASYNDIEGSLPMNLGINLPNLQTIGLGYNRLTGPIPGSLANVSSLVNIFVPRNEFTGKLPVLGNMPSLHRIVVSLNRLGNGESDDKSFFSSLINATSLEELSVDGNNLEGVLPESIGNFSTILKRLNLAENFMFGSIPTGLGNLIQLETINLGGNQFSGNIPSSIGDLLKLKVLNISDNNLLGNIPSSVGNLSMLITFNLGGNNLQGSIPSSLGNCQNLAGLELAKNKLTGTLPTEVLGIATLVVLNVSQNNLTGSLPIEVGNLINVERLDVSENMFSGEIPSSLSRCVRVERLYMQGNFFSGEIPSLLSSLRGIQFLDLSRNNLSGEIPDYLEEFQFLQSLNLSFNDFEGFVPTQGIFENTSAISLIGNEKLCGGLQELGLPTCTSKGSTKEKLSRTLKILLFTIPGIIVLSLCLLFVVWFRKRRIRPSLIAQESSLLKVSYRSLLIATAGFSSTNLIGSGSFGSVYKAILSNQNGGMAVAVKVLDLTNNPGASKSFKSECEALRNIRHRNLVKILTACSSLDHKGNEFMALVYEFMENGNLEEWLHVKGRERKLSFLQRLNIAIDVACAVDYLHHGCQTPIIHCDLKPSNVLLDADMTAHVGDFGLARFVLQQRSDSSNNQTSSIGIRGTVGYAAPEYGMGSHVSIQGDVYSYGILLLEMFSGRRPTDEMFKDNLSLHSFAEKALSGRVEEIADPILLEQESEEAEKDEELVEAEDEEAASPSTNTTRSNDDYVSRRTIEECLVSVFRIGVACSVELPRERLDMGDVVAQLQLIKNCLI